MRSPSLERWPERRGFVRLVRPSGRDGNAGTGCNAHRDFFADDLWPGRRRARAFYRNHGWASAHLFGFATRRAGGYCRPASGIGTARRISAADRSGRVMPLAQLTQSDNQLKGESQIMNVDENIIRAKESVVNDLLKRPGITGVDVGFKYTGGRRTDQ